MRTTIHKVRHVRQQTRIPQILHADDFTASEKIFNVKSLTCIHVQGDLTAKVSNIKSQVVVKRKVIISPSLKCTESLTLYIVFLIGSFNCCRQLTTSFKLIRSPFQVIIFFTFVICACISVQIFLKLNMNIFSISSWDWLHGSRPWWTISTPGPCGYPPLSSSCSTSSTGSPTDTWGQSSSPSPSHVPRVPKPVAPQPPTLPSRNAVILR